VRSAPTGRGTVHWRLGADARMPKKKKSAKQAKPQVMAMSATGATLLLPDVEPEQAVEVEYGASSSHRAQFALCALAHAHGRSLAFRLSMQATSSKVVGNPRTWCIATQEVWSA
jgi:hypothetical protein